MEKYAALEGCDCPVTDKTCWESVLDTAGRQSLFVNPSYLFLAGFGTRTQRGCVYVCFTFCGIDCEKQDFPPGFLLFLTSAFSFLRKQWISTIFTKKRKKQAGAYLQQLRFLGISGQVFLPFRLCPNWLQGQRQGATNNFSIPDSHLKLYGLLFPGGYKGLPAAIWWLPKREWKYAFLSLQVTRDTSSKELPQSPHCLINDLYCFVLCKAKSKIGTD